MPSKYRAIRARTSGRRAAYGRYDPGRRYGGDTGRRESPDGKGNRIRNLALISMVTILLAGCYNPRGAFYAHVGQAATYWSTESLPATITIVDTRTGEPFFTVEIPVGKQLVIDFKELRNGITVPDSFSRRIDVSYRAAPEYADTPDDPLRVDENRPDWWTPRGGPMPGNDALHIYDG